MSLTKLASALLALTAIGTQAQAAMIYIEVDTHLKSSTAQASSLPATSKCVILKNTAIEISSIADGGADHFRVTLPRAYTGCALTTAYVYKPHMATDTTAMSTYLATVFKKTTASSSALPASSKCAMPIGVYGSSSTVTTASGHRSLNLKSFLPNCGFSAGYVFDGHSNAGITMLSLADSLWFKKSTADSSTLPASDKCLIPKGSYVLTKAPTANGAHWQVSMAKAPSGCAFSTGFVYFELTYLAQPSGSSTSYTIPLRNGFQGSAWCVCRSVGTSPHIGQDWNADGAETSVAIANGSIVAKNFDPDCGHAVTLRDSGGADWIYRHLNSNSLAIGQTVTKGQTIGNHSAYPTSGCGTGPHLHIERRSAGGFGDSAVFKSCEAGPEPCHFDPNRPFSKSAVVSNVAADLAPELPDNKPSACRANPAGYAEVLPESMVDYAAVESGVVVHADSIADGEEQLIELGVALSGNADNRCDNGSCVSALTLVAETSDGTLRRVFHFSNLRNKPAAVLSEEQHCLPTHATGKAHLLMRDGQGRRFRTEVELR